MCRLDGIRYILCGLYFICPFIRCRREWTIIAAIFPTINFLIENKMCHDNNMSRALETFDRKPTRPKPSNTSRAMLFSFRNQRIRKQGCYCFSFGLLFFFCFLSFFLYVISAILRVSCRKYYKYDIVNLKLQGY